MTVRVTRNTMSASLERIQREFDALPRQAFQVWLENTPQRSGNARRKTRLQGSRIQANYPYAEQLDQGSSSLSPQGMSQPTSDFIADRISRIGK